MARKKTVTKSLDQAFAEASSRIVHDAIKDLPSNMTMGELVDEFAESEYNDYFRETTLGELVGSLGGRRGGSAAARAGAGRTTRRSGGGAGGGGSKKYNTRTAEGREKLQTAVAEMLSEAGSAPSEAIRKKVGGSPAQLRQALARLKDEGKVKTTGQKRATVYHWKARK